MKNWGYALCKMVSLYFVIITVTYVLVVRFDSLWFGLLLFPMSYWVMNEDFEVHS